MIQFTQSLLQSTDPKTLRNFFDPSDEASSRAASPEPADPADNIPEPPARASLAIPGPRSRRGSRASSPPPRPVSISSLQSLHAESELEMTPHDGVFHASPKQFTLKVGGRVHVFELSLCGNDEFGHDRVSASRP